MSYSISNVSKFFRCVFVEIFENTSFNGNNKSIEELEYALDNNINHISVDNFYELKILNSIAKEKNKIHINKKIENLPTFNSIHIKIYYDYE